MNEESEQVERGSLVHRLAPLRTHGPVDQPGERPRGHIAPREVAHQREPQNRLGYALQLGALRYLGFVPADLKTMPSLVVQFDAEQLAIEPHVLEQYAIRR